ncbi:MAG: 30S ribosomal protein S20 [Gammaproteobacteria bacterium]|nr:30S ribosomal protein S20 [Gammaproteobacteria bacterium]
MANTAQAKKRARQAEKHRQLNAGQRSAMRTDVKKAVQALSAGDKAEASAAYKQAVSTLDAMARKGHIHKNKAARHKSRLNTRLRALATA